MKDYSPDCRGNTAAGNFACEELQQKREILREKLSQEKKCSCSQKNALLIFINKVYLYNLGMTYSENSVLNLISRIHSQSQDFLQGKLFNVGLKELATSHGNILFSLSQNETMNLGELAKRINRDKSTTTILVKKLQNEGFIEIKKDETDARKKIIQLTTKGKSYNEQTAKVSNDLISTCYKGFSQDEKKQLVELLNKLCLNLV